MTNHEGDYRGFYQLSRAWYAEANLKNVDYKDEVMFGFYCPDGGTSGEMAMRWYEVGKSISPQLQMFDDAFHTLAQFKDVIDKLAEVDDMGITPKQFCDILLECGFADNTPTTR